MSGRGDGTEGSHVGEAGGVIDDSEVGDADDGGEASEAGGRGSVGTVRRDRPPPAGPRRPLRLPELTTFRLPSGLTVRVVEDHRLPEVSLSLLCEAGALSEVRSGAAEAADGEAAADREAGGDGRSDPEGEMAPAGTAELAGRLLTEGAAGRPAPEMAEWLDRLGAAFHVSVGYDTATLGMHTLSGLLEASLDFLAAVALRPDFPADEVERVRQEMVDELRREEDEPETVADRALLRAVYGRHRFGTPVAGLPSSVRTVERDAVRRFHGRAFGARDATLVVCGDVEVASLREALAARFGTWDPGEGRVEAPAPPPQAAAAGRVLLLDRPGSAQAELRVGAVGAAFGEREHFAILVANAVLGGLFNSRINMKLREEKGWTYGARTSFHFRRLAGPFVGRAAVESPAAGAALEEFLAQIRGMVDDPPDGGELRLARNALALSLHREFETAAQVSRKIAALAVYDLPDDYWTSFADRVEAVTAEEVVAAVERRLDPGKLTAVVVADAEEVGADLERRFDEVEVRPAAGVEEGGVGKEEGTSG